VGEKLTVFSSTMLHTAGVHPENNADGINPLNPDLLTISTAVKKLF
jgi:hypothetical protein